MAGKIVQSTINDMTLDDKNNLYKAIKNQLELAVKKLPEDIAAKRKGETTDYIELSTSSRHHTSNVIREALNGIKAPQMLPSMLIYVYDGGEITIQNRDQNRRNIVEQNKDKTREAEPRIGEYDFVSVDYEDKPATPKRLKSLAELNQDNAVEFKFTGEQTLVKVVPVGTLVIPIRDGRIEGYFSAVNEPGLFRAQEEEQHVVLRPGTYKSGLSPADIDSNAPGIIAQIAKRDSPQFNPIKQFNWQITEVAPGVYEPTPVKFYRVTEPVAIGEGFDRIKAKAGDWLSLNNGPSGTDELRMRLYTGKELEEMIAAGKITPVKDELGRGETLKQLLPKVHVKPIGNNFRISGSPDNIDSLNKAMRDFLPKNDLAQNSLKKAGNILKVNNPSSNPELRNILLNAHREQERGGPKI